MKGKLKRIFCLMLSVVMLGLMFNITPLIATADDYMAYKDLSLSFEERAADLVSRMTLEEKEKQLGNSSPAITRLGVSNYGYWNEALHGVANINEGENSTSFPYSLSMAASWDRDLVKEIAAATGDEARSYNQKRNKGLTYWSPTINLARDPRWGRNHESFGEDPYLTSQIGVSFVDGFQGDDAKYYKIVSTLKHYALNNSEYNRHRGTSNADERDIREYYTRAFKDIALITSQYKPLGSVMSAYNRINEVPASANAFIMDTLLRKTFGFTGFTVSDCGAINNMYETGNHNWMPTEDNNKYTPVKVTQRYLDTDGRITPAGATALGIMAGTDMDCGSVYPNNALSAVRNGLMSEDDIDIALLRIFTTRMKLGEFDPADQVPYKADEYSYANQVTSKKHKQLAEDAADQGIVLLKNEAVGDDTDPILPLDKNNKSVVLVGPSSIASSYILGAYSGIPFAEDTSTPKQGIEKMLGQNVTHITGGSYATTIAQQLRNIFLLDENGEVLRTLTPYDSPVYRGVTRQNEDGGRFGYVYAECLVTYPNVDLTGVKTIAIEINSNNGTKGCEIIYSMKAEQGSMPVASVVLGSSYSQYAKANATIHSTGGYDQGELSFTVIPPAQEVNLTVAEQNTIRNADTVIVAIGSEHHDSTEGGDRAFLSMPRLQDNLARDIISLNPRTVVYIQSVGMFEIGKFVDIAPAIMWCAYNGQAQGNAMARVIFGESNPTGKIPFTWYADESQLPTINDYHIRQDDFEGKSHGGWTYQYFTGDVTFPFGHGLSYTPFEYSNMTVNKTDVTPDDKVTVTVDVENLGNRDSAEVVQLYLVPPVTDRDSRPGQQLKAFDKVKLGAGEKKTVTLTADMSKMYFWDEAQQKNIYDLGDYIIQVGPSSGDIYDEATVTMTGKLTDKIQAVTASPNKLIINAGNPDVKIDAGLTVCLTDDSFLDLARKDISVVYSSSDNSVATVDSKGFVTAVGEGLVTITAAVTVNGETVEDTFPVVVIDTEEVALSSIRVDGKRISGFNAKRYAYDYCVPVDQVQIPVFTATASADIEITVAPAASIPGTAKITAKKGTIEVEYTVNIGYPPVSDDFTTGAIGSQWNVIRETPADYNVNTSGLHITSQNGDIQNANNRNMFVQPGMGNWTVTTDIVVEHVPNANYQQMGLVVYEDVLQPGSNINAFVKTMIEYSGDFHIMSVGRRNSSNTNSLYDRTDDARVIKVGDIVTLKIERNGDNYTSYFSINGNAFKSLGTVVFTMESVKVGFAAYSSGNTTFNTTFKNFSVELPPQDTEEYGEVLDIELNQVSMEGFNPEKTDYTVIVPDGENAPAITDVNYEGDLDIEIDQASSVPGKAIVQAGFKGAWKDYVINFEYEKKHKVTYKANGGSGADIESELLAYGGNYYTDFNTFTYEGYVFTGWNTAANGKGVSYGANRKMGISGSVTLYAQWRDENISRYKGDVNDDNYINIFDIMMIRDHIFGKNILHDDDFIAADVNDDEDVNIFDIMLIRDHIFGKIDLTVTPD